MVDRALAELDKDFDKLYSGTGRASIPPEQLLRALLLPMILYSVRSETQLIEPLEYNLLFRWFVGLEMDDAVWVATVFSKNRERLIEGAVSRRMLEAVLDQARAHNLLSEEHFTVAGTPIQAWAAARSFQKKNPPARGEGSGHNGAVLLRDKAESRTDPEARLYKKATADKAVPAYQGHAPIENRNGLVVAAEATQAATVAERESALRPIDEAVAPQPERAPEQKIALGADTQYQEKKFLEALRQRKIAPHVSEYTTGQNMAKNSLTEAERNDERRVIGQKKRKLVERVFGWSKADSILRQVKVRGLDRVDWFYRLTLVGYNLVRMRRLIPIAAAAR